VAVEDAEAEGREDEETGAGEEDPDEPDRQLAPLPGKPGGEDVDEERRRQDAEGREKNGQEGEERPDGSGRAARLLLLPLGQEARVDGNERGGERALAEEILRTFGRSAARRASAARELPR
jgi:hypothetical protein